MKPMSPTTQLAVWLIVLYVLANALWLAVDTTPPQSDSVYYIQGGFRLIKSLQADGLAGLLAIPDLVQNRPPLQSILGALIAPLVRWAPDRLAWINLLWLSLAAWFTFVAAKIVWDERCGLAALLFVIANPLAHEYLPYFEPEVPLSFCAIVLFVLLVDLAQRPRLATAIVAGGVIAAGLLLKWIFALFALGPVAIAGYRLMKNETKLAGRTRMCLAMGLAPALFAFPWYLSRWNDLLAYHHTVADLGYFTPFTEGWSWAVLVYYPYVQMVKIKAVHALALAGGTAAALIMACRRSVPRLPVVMMFSMLIAPYLFFAVSYQNLAQKYLLPVQPILAVLASSVFLRISKPWLRVAWAGWGIVCCAIWAHQQWNPLGLATPAPAGSDMPLMLRPETDFFEYTPRPPQRRELPHESLAARIAELAGHESSKSVKVMVVPNLDGFSAFTCSVWLEAVLPRPEPMGVSKHRVVLDLLYHDFIVVSASEYHRAPNHRDHVDPFRYQATLAAGKWFDPPGPRFFETHRLVGTYSYRGAPDKIYLYRRIQPVQHAEAMEILALCSSLLARHREMWPALEIVLKRLKAEGPLARAPLFQAALFDRRPEAAARLYERAAQEAYDWQAYERALLSELPPLPNPSDARPNRELKD